MYKKILFITFFSFLLAQHNHSHDHSHDEFTRCATDELEQELQNKHDNGQGVTTPRGENENHDSNGHFGQDLHDALDAQDAMMDDIVQHMSTKK